jgi:hypothetical protein
VGVIWRAGLQKPTGLPFIKFEFVQVAILILDLDGALIVIYGDHLENALQIRAGVPGANLRSARKHHKENPHLFDEYQIQANTVGRISPFLSTNAAVGVGRRVFSGGGSKRLLMQEICGVPERVFG